MKTVRYEAIIQISEQEALTSPLISRISTAIEPLSTVNPKSAEPNPNASFHALLLRQALLRSQVQAAIYELIRGYEATSGFSVVRLDLQAKKRRVILDAIPVNKHSQLA